MMGGGGGAHAIDEETKTWKLSYFPFTIGQPPKVNVGDESREGATTQ